jgi:hypothetical protein
MKSTLQKSKFASILILLLVTSRASYAQFGDKMKKGLNFYLDSKDSSRFIKFEVVTQLWTRYTDASPLTQVGAGGAGVAGNYSQRGIADVSVRRARLIMSGQLTDRIAFFTQFGENSLNYTSARKAGTFFHDITIDYAVIKRYFSLGFGLNGWNGPSRFSNISTSSIMVLDPPNFQEVTNDTYDQFVRRYGIYAKGKIGKFDYRLSAAKPFISQTGSAINPLNPSGGNTATTSYSTFSSLPPQLVYQGYVMYQFLDEESNFGPSLKGTYLGKKTIFNIGAGFYYQHNAMMLNTQTKVGGVNDTLQQDIFHFAADVFYDAPLNKDKGNAISFYGSYSNYNYGKNFVRVAGADNPANAVATSTVTLPNTANLPIKGPTAYDKQNYGNAVPYLGTGNILYGQLGYKFKDDLLGKQGTLQVYGNCQYAIYDALSDPMLLWDAGINWLIKGHNSKFTLDYQNRPYFSENNVGQLKQMNRYGQLVLQYQIAF